MPGIGCAKDVGRLESDAAAVRRSSSQAQQQSGAAAVRRVCKKYLWAFHSIRGEKKSQLQVASHVRVRQGESRVKAGCEVLGML